MIDESLTQYLGLYAAENSQPPAVRDAVEQADLILDIGGVLLTELNTGMWGDALGTTRAACIHDNWVRIGTKVFLNVAIDDVLDGLIARVTPIRGTVAAVGADLLDVVGSGNEPTSSANFYPRLQRVLQSGDTLVIETGTSMFHLNGCGARSAGPPRPPWGSPWRRAPAGPGWSPATDRISSPSTSLR